MKRQTGLGESPPPSRAVFVCNISYEATEQQLKELFSQAGKVINFKFVYDREGKPGGLGFCEYSDIETAESAVRNLNEYDFMGRSLRVDFADDERLRRGGFGSMTGKYQGGQRKIPREFEAKPHPDRGINLIQGLVKHMDRSQMVELLKETKQYIRQHPEAARQLLLENPQLGQALLQVQVLLGLVKEEDIKSLVRGGPASTSKAPDAGGPMNGRPGGPPGRQGYPPRQPYMGPMGGGMGGGMMGPGGPPRGPGGPPRGPPRGPPGGGLAGALGGFGALMGGPGSGGPASLDPTRKKILEWVLKATPEQIHRLNPDAQELVLKIRQQNMLNQNQRRP